MSKLIKEGIIPGFSIKNPYVSWLATISRDNQMIIWKLFDGKIMHTDLALNLKKQKVIRNGQLADRSSIWMLSVHAWYF